MSDNLRAFLTKTGRAAASIPRSTSRMRSMSVVRALISSKQAMVQMGTKWSLSIWDIRYRSFDRFSLQTPKTISIFLFFLINFWILNELFRNRYYTENCRNSMCKQTKLTAKSRTRAVSSKTPSSFLRTLVVPWEHFHPWLTQIVGRTLNSSSLGGQCHSQVPLWVQGHSQRHCQDTLSWILFPLKRHCLCYLRRR